MTGDTEAYKLLVDPKETAVTVFYPSDCMTGVVEEDLGDSWLVSVYKDGDLWTPSYYTWAKGDCEIATPA